MPIIKSPLTGRIIDLEEVPDQVFANRVVGDGIAIEPTDNILYSPVEGEIKQLFPTMHAVGIETKEGLEVLLHIGINTVELDGEGFSKFVSQGDQIKEGTKLIEFDLDYIEKNATSTVTPILITNLEDSQEIELIADSEVEVSTELFKVIET
ncbi:PTS system IIA component, Glc family (TC 4.A.1) [Selenihalanaerobacter shriftii]|uniref:PTS system IIA component, Glc family (TC 4.A.1) n=2 Tax=Selenihalanaerobacter shriftii TaxID=142842 RepID=A0A1T4PTB3_9FIRM|nr:PTS system IIA component, Glc family (TC 4.A.1) [Selenihalanaerobacter shriftii]